MENKASHFIKSFICGVFIFITASALMLGILLLSAMIPKEAIREKTLESAQFLYDGELFGTIIEDVDASKIDRYADAILLNIAYHYDAEHPLSSVMLSAYYFTIIHEENENLLEAVRDDKDANQQYLRYWHGSIAIVRPLLTVLSIRQIYILNGIVLILLTALYMFITIRKKLLIPALGMGISLILTGCWFVPLSLEYTWTVQLMLVSSIIAVFLSEKKKGEDYIPFFMLAGMVTSFLDFLTSETLTLTIPLLIILWVEKSGDREKISKKTWIMSLKNVIAWGIGYVGMWVLKWILAGIVFQENVMPYVTEHIGERLSGDLGLNVWQYFTGAVARNVGCLFPFGYGGFGAFAGILLVVFTAYIGYVYHRKDFDTGFILLCILIGLIPFIRYLILHNHSYIHCFFTYRAQVAAVLAAVFFISELTGMGKKKQ